MPKFLIIIRHKEYLYIYVYYIPGSPLDLAPPQQHRIFSQPGALRITTVQKAAWFYMVHFLDFDLFFLFWAYYKKNEPT